MDSGEIEGEDILVLKGEKPFGGTSEGCSPEQPKETKQIGASGDAPSEKSSRKRQNKSARQEMRSPKMTNKSAYQEMRPPKDAEKRNSIKQCITLCDQKFSKGDKILKRNGFRLLGWIER